MKEFEKKVLLTEDEYLAIFHDSPCTTPLTIQTNYYYDTPDLRYNAQGTTLRVRKKGEHFIATVKRHDSNSNLSVEESMRVKGEFDTNFFYGYDVVFQGALTTERALVYKRNNVTATIDKNSYLKTTDYELEVEYDEGCEKDAIDMLIFIANSLNKNNRPEYVEDFIKRSERSISKSTRFFCRKLCLDLKEGNSIEPHNK